jgi:hypothetical protein
MSKHFNFFFYTQHIHTQKMPLQLMRHFFMFLFFIGACKIVMRLHNLQKPSHHAVLFYKW